MNADQRVRRMHGAPLALLGLLLVAFAGPSAAQAGESAVKLALLPVAQPGAYFDLTLRPGDTRSLQVDIASLGDAEIAARTYATDVYTIINGGFGGRLRDTPQTGVTTWLDYPTDVIALPAGTTIRRAFAVTVPKHAGPGEYITALVLENDRPIANNGPVALDQVMRQAIAVVVTVPGARTPSLSIGAATHKVVAGTSVVSIAVENTGNVRLKPLVTFALFDGAGAQVSTASLQMDTFYAHTNTTVEMPLARVLSPGDYTVRLTLVDTGSGARADGPAILLVVEARTGLAPSGGSAANPTQVVMDPGEGQIPLLVVGIALGVGLLVGGLSVGLLALILRRRRQVGAPGS